jgi:anti-anti-sigma factor
MDFAHSQSGNFLILQISGRLDINSSSEFEKELHSCLDKGHSGIVVDMAGIEYISSAGLRSILVVAKAAKALDSEIRFCGVAGMVDEVFTISGFKKMFKIFATAAEATAA